MYDGVTRWLHIKTKLGGLNTQELSEVQQHKAFHLYRWAREAGKSVSRDEVADMVCCPTV